MRRNTLILQKKFSTRWRHLYFSASWGGCPEVPLRIGITASVPRPAKYLSNRIASNALSSTNASQAMPPRDVDPAAKARVDGVPVAEFFGQARHGAPVRA